MEFIFNGFGGFFATNLFSKFQKVFGSYPFTVLLKEFSTPFYQEKVRFYLTSGKYSPTTFMQWRRDFITIVHKTVLI